LAELLGLSVRSVVRAVDRLVKMGLFRRVRHGGYSNRNSYEPFWCRFEELESDWRIRFESASRKRGTLATSSTGQPCPPGGDAAVHQTKYLNLKKRNLHPGNRQRYSLTPRPLSSTQAAHVEADRRLHEGLRDTLPSPTAYSEAISAIDDSTWNQAIEEEVRRRGDGINLLVSLLARQQK
jgi:hypothetical protein